MKWLLAFLLALPFIVAYLTPAFYLLSDMAAFYIVILYIPVAMLITHLFNIWWNVKHFDRGSVTKLDVADGKWKSKAWRNASLESQLSLNLVTRYSYETMNTSALLLLLLFFFSDAIVEAVPLPSKTANLLVAWTALALLFVAFAALVLNLSKCLPFQSVLQNKKDLSSLWLILTLIGFSLILYHTDLTSAFRVNGVTAVVNYPVLLSDSNPWKEVATGSDATWAIMEDGSLWSWGGNKYGQLGRGATTDMGKMSRIGRSNDWTKVRSYSGYVIAERKDGSLWVWGQNDRGQLGIGTTSDALTPVRVSGDRKWISASPMGGIHTKECLNATNILWP